MQLFYTLVSYTYHQINNRSASNKNAIKRTFQRLSFIHIFIMGLAYLKLLLSTKIKYPL
jgi:predicted membrane channel-forming protein YqfA (hemolysin III family)